MNKKSHFMPDKNKKRLMKDVAKIIKNPLADNGIYYVHDCENMLKGYALVFGPGDSLYRYGSYLFTLSFPKEYPFVPPKVTYMTNNGSTRFHPNLYRNGKVCLSLLNTWKGEQWTSCQTIKSVLINLVALLHNEPLLNEPGIKKSHRDFKNYNDIIRYQNYNTAVLGMLTRKFLPETFSSFFSIIKNHINNNKESILNDIDELIQTKNEIVLSTGIYNMNSTLAYNKLKIDMLKAFESNY